MAEPHSKFLLLFPAIIVIVVIGMVIYGSTNEPVEPEKTMEPEDKPIVEIIEEPPVIIEEPEEVDEPTEATEKTIFPKLIGTQGENWVLLEMHLDSVEQICSFQGFIDFDDEEITFNEGRFENSVAVLGAFNDPDGGQVRWAGASTNSIDPGVLATFNFTTTTPIDETTFFLIIDKMSSCDFEPLTPQVAEYTQKDFSWK